MRELKTFVDGLPQMMAMKQSLATHTSIAEQVKEETERRQFLEFLQAEQELLNFQGLASISWIFDRFFSIKCSRRGRQPMKWVLAVVAISTKTGT